MVSSQPIKKATVKPPGTLVDIGGFRLHLYCAGPVDATNDVKTDRSIDNQLRLPTLVIEAGCGWHSAMYIRLQERLSQSLRVCSYDRAGLGWSDESHQPRDAKTIAMHLHRLLIKAGIDGPLVLIGHSIAGLYLRVFANYYPDRIVGVVLLDASHPDQYDLLTLKEYSLGKRLLNILIGLCAWTGLTRYYNPLLNVEDGTYHYLPASAKAQLIALSHRRQTYITPIKESDAFARSAGQALEADSLRDLPLLLLTGLDRSEVPFRSERERARYTKDWLSLQLDLLEISRDSQHKIIDGASHSTLITQREYSEQVVTEILQFVSDNAKTTNC